MEEATNATRYWCHMCYQTVTTVLTEDEIKCTFCRSGFVEEMDDDQRAPTTSILMNNSETETGNGRDLASQLQEILRRRRRRSPSSVVQQLRVRALEPESNRGDDDDDDDDGNNNNNERGGVIVINPVIPVPSSVVVVGSPNEYFIIGPGFEALLQRLAENDPNRYGTPPARKEDVESLATVKIQEAGLQCSVCLDDFEVGVEAKQMPCKHDFHPDCLLPWLELHSSCPLCRYQLPTDETNATDSATTEETNESHHATSSSDGNRHEEEENDDDGNMNAFSIPWRLSSLFSSSSQDSNPSN